MVLIAIKEMKEASYMEVFDYIKEKHDLEIPQKKLVRYLRRWKKGKAITSSLLGTQVLYSIRDIPWWPEAQMVNIIKPDVSELDAKEFLDAYKDELKERGYISERQPDIRDYDTYELTMEAVDYIAGGLTDDAEEKMGERLLEFPKIDGRPIIPRGWFKGWFRGNARLMNVNESQMINYIGFSVGEFLDTVKLEQKTAIGMKGPQTHEVVSPGSRFKFFMEWPTHGLKMKSEEDLRVFFKKLEISPIRGLGAYERAFGGRVKLLEMNKK